METLAPRRDGAVVAIRRLWEELGLPQLRPQGQERYAVEEAIFRLVANCLIEPRSKLSTVEWQRDVEWPQGGALADHPFLRAMDALLPEKERLEVELFARLRNLFRVALRLVGYDLTSTYTPDGSGDWVVREVRPHQGRRRVVVYSA